MIIRTGHANIRYSHDAEAAFACLRLYREFRHVADEQLRTAIENRLDFAPSYWTDPDHETFVASRDVWWTPPPECQRVSLFHFEWLTREVLDDFGFSCPVCGTPTAAKERGHLFDSRIEQVFYQHQAILAPLLICRECARFVESLIGPWRASEPAQLIENFIVHLVVARKVHAA